MYRFSLFMVYKYLTSKKSERGISAMIIMSWITVMVSSCVLVLINGIMNGFQKETIASLQGLHPQITIQAEQDDLNVSLLTDFLAKQVTEIQAWAPRTTRYGMIYNKTSSAKPIIISALFIDPLKESAVTSLQHFLTVKKPLKDILTANAVIIGTEAAQHLQLQIGDECTVLLANTDTHEKDFSYEKIKVSVGGIIKTGVDDIDMHTLFCSYDLFNKIYEQDEVEQLNIKLYEQSNEQKVIEKIRTVTGLTVFSWQDNYPALLDAMKLEKKVAVLITFLIIAMAMISMIALLYMFVQSKQADSALLFILGASLQHIRAIFMMIGLLLVSSAALCGTLCAALCGYMINVYKLFPLPDAYYISHITVLLEPLNMLYWYFSIVVVGFFAVLIPIQCISSYTIANIIRFER